MYSGKLDVFAQKWLYSWKLANLGKVALFGQRGCIQVKGLYSKKKWLFLGKSGCIRAKWLYSDRVVVYGKY